MTRAASTQSRPARLRYRRRCPRWRYRIPDRTGKGDHVAANNEPAALMEEWLDSDSPGLHGKAMAAATITAYRNDVTLFLTWASEGGVDDPLAATEDDIAAFVADRRANHADSESTATRRLVAVGAWFRWLMAEGRVTTNPTASIARDFGTTAKSAPQLTLTQAANLLDAADDAGSLESAVVHLMLEAGASVGTVLNGTGAYVDGTPAAPVLHLAVAGKETAVVLPADTWARIQRYLQDAGRPPLPASVDAAVNEALFTLDDGKPLYRLWLDRTIKKVAAAAGIHNAAALRPQSLPATFRALQQIQTASFAAHRKQTAAQA
jgi:integrase/recombinase XerD